MEPTRANIKWAERKRALILDEIERGLFIYSNHFPDSKRARLFGHSNESERTIGDLLTAYLARVDKTLQKSTAQGYRDAAEGHLIPTFGAVQVGQLTAAQIREWVSGLSVTLKTARNIITPLRAVLEEALNDDIIQSNPLDRVILSKLINKETANSDWEVDPFTLEEMRLLLDTAHGQTRNLLQFAFWTGLRTSELIALGWDDIDWVHGLVRVNKAYVLGEIKTTKTKAGIRDVMLHAPAIDALNAQKPHTFMLGGRIFYQQFSGQPWESPHQIRDAWRWLIRKSGIRYRNPYQTRHTFASMMLSNGENELWVSNQLGHKTVDVVRKHYGRWIKDAAAKTGYKPVNDWGKVFNGIATNSPQKISSLKNKKQKQ